MAAFTGPGATFTGADNDQPALGLTGETWSVQGNTLATEEVVRAAAASLEAMTALPLAERLMRAMEAASAEGGDNRCDPAQSAKSAFLFVARPDDDPKRPWLEARGPPVGAESDARAGSAVGARDEKGEVCPGRAHSPRTRVFGGRRGARTGWSGLERGRARAALWSAGAWGRLSGCLMLPIAGVQPPNAVWIRPRHLLALASESAMSGLSQSTVRPATTAAPATTAEPASTTPDQNTVGNAAIASQISGTSAAPDYNPEFWNTGDVKRSNNCYSYAVNDLDGGAYGVGSTPGAAAGKPAQAADGGPALIAACVADGLILAAGDGTLAEHAPAPPAPPEGHYLVALYLDPKEGEGDFTDYHWYRRDSNGKWSHKQGRQAVSNQDFAHNEIGNLSTADTGTYLWCAYFFIPQQGIDTEFAFQPSPSAG